MLRMYTSFFFFNDTATTEIYTLSLHDALPILLEATPGRTPVRDLVARHRDMVNLDVLRLVSVSRIISTRVRQEDRKSTRLNSSHANISYAVFCLKKKKISTNSTKTRYNDTLHS